MESKEITKNIESNKNESTKSKEELTINLNKRNKLRKLKKEIGESEITNEEYESRIREHYNNMVNIKYNDLYKWAKDEDNEDETTN